MLDRIIDAHGNFIDFAYLNDQSTFYPSSIAYTGHAPSGGSPTNSLTISYTTRSDARITNELGVRQTRSLIPTQLRTYHGADLVRTFALNYIESPSTHRSLLQSIDVQNADGSAARARSYGYSEATVGYSGSEIDGSISN